MDNYIVKAGDTYTVSNGKFDLVIQDITPEQVRFVVRGEGTLRSMTRVQFHDLMREDTLMLLSRAS